MKKALLTSCVLLALAGCASLDTAGHAAYSVKANAGGGWDLDAKDGKEFEGRRILFDAKAGTLAVEEGASKAFKGQAIAAKAQAVFPVTDLANILVGGDRAGK